MRRRHFTCGLAVLVSACGFHPLYSPSLDKSANLASVYVGIISNRPGQLLRQALQTRLEGSSSGIAKRFNLGVSYSENIQGVSIQPDNSTTRTRDISTATWSLYAAGDYSNQLAGGSVRTVDGYNIIDEQFFYGTLSEEEAQRRMANALADQIVEGLAVYFARHPARG